ncbi:hypothetical protein J5N97_012054 [Dioscorea zingiberensis]|uniref:Autophagy-related protein 13 N-terminal domain-containing protein n=1 Tax=Dioscorea zingiberensis TaxID=325984 RepID=A0A9D5CNG7_9LILI|nr:hypothetical protein J5N97_012054 [Dioscorea zingiberensis]
MASTPCSTPLEFIERLVTEFFSKSIHTILDSRSSSSSSSSSSARPGEDWFNLQLRGNPAELEKVKQWRRSNAELLVVDVLVVSRKERHLQQERVVERWSIQHEIRKVGAIDMVAVSKKAYKKSIIVLRSLYATARMLPAYKLFRELSYSSSSGAGLSFSHRISPFMEPFTREEEAQMKGFSFSPVDTPLGRLCLSVSYIPVLEPVSLKPPPPLMETELIPDYVGSPAIDRFKIFNSLPSSLQTCVPSSAGPVQKDLLRIDSAPVSSALHRPPKNNAYLGHGSPLSPFMPKALGSRELLRMGGFQISMALQKAVSLGKDGVGKLHRLKKSSCSSSRNPSSRSFSKLPVFDDEPEIYCPFAVDDEENVKVSAERIESLNGRACASQNSEKGQLIVRKKEDYCAIGTLLQMLKTAAPLNKDHSKLMRPSQALKHETGRQRAEQNQDRAMKLSNTDSNSKIFKSRTTSDALQELQNYKQIKNWLLTTKSKGGSRTLTTPNSPKSITID